jgi:GNAT superfamily N-acetyltransferase
VQLRPAEQPADRPFLVEMARLACSLEDREPPAEDDPDMLGILPRASDAALIATDDRGRPIGAAWWHLDDIQPLVRDQDGRPLPELAVAVLEEARGQGVGTNLVNALAAQARERNFSALSLNVHLRNPVARLYMRTGFRVVGAGRGWFGVAMSRTLGG